jgi:WD40 repeat protein
MKLSKLFFLLISGLIGLIAFNTVAQDDTANRVGFITADAPINVRSRPNTSGAVISSLPPNTSVEVLDQSDDGAWVSVGLPDGEIGWVSASFIRVMESAVPADLVPIMPDNAAQLQEITEFASILATGLVFSPDGRLLASYSWERGIVIFDVRTKILVATLSGHTDLVSGLAFSPDGSELASSSWDGSVKIWNTQTWGERTTFQGHTDGVTGVAYSPDGTLLASVGMDGLLVIWNRATGERVHDIEVGNRRMRSVAFSRDGAAIATAGDSYGSVVHVWDVETGEELWSKRDVGNLHIAFSPVSDTLIVLGGTAGVVFTGYDVATHEQTFKVYAPGGSAASLAVNPSGTLVAGGEWGTGRFSIASIADEEMLFTDITQRGNRSVTVSVAFSPDSRLLATADGDKAMRLWGVHGSN